MILYPGLNMVMIMFACVTAYLTYCFSSRLYYRGEGALYSLSWVLVPTPARYYFALFMLQTTIAAETAGHSFGYISNHIIISLDIIYFISILILILFHVLKYSGNPPMNAI